MGFDLWLIAIFIHVHFAMQLKTKILKILPYKQFPVQLLQVIFSTDFWNREGIYYKK
jgi:hypothetical protein